MVEGCDNLAKYTSSGLQSLEHLSHPSRPTTYTSSLTPLPFAPLQPHWSPCYSLQTPGTPPPQGHGTCCSFWLECSFLRDLNGSLSPSGGQEQASPFRKTLPEHLIEKCKPPTLTQTFSISLPAFFSQSISSQLTYDVFYLFICLFSVSVSLQSISSTGLGFLSASSLSLPQPSISRLCLRH